MVDNEPREVLVVTAVMRPLARAGSSSWRVWRGRVASAAATAAGAAGSVVRALLVTVVAVRGAAALLLISYGAWLAYRPAGFIVGGLLLLVDRMLDERKEPT